MPVTPADIDAAVPPAGTPNRGLTNTALKGLITDIANVGVGIGVGTVSTFADLPAPATVTGQRWWVLTSTGVWLVNRRTKGAYYSDGVVWSFLGDFPVTAAEVGNVPAGGIAAADVQAAINELDTEKAPKGVVTGSGLTMATARLLGRSTASSGAIEEITLGTNLSFSGTTLNATGGGGGSDPVDLGNPPTTTPAAGDFSLGAQTHAGLTLPVITSNGTWTQGFQPLLGRGRTIGYLGSAGATTISAFPGTQSLTIVGTGTVRQTALTNLFTRQFRVGWVSAAAAGSLTSQYNNGSGNRNLYLGNSGANGFLYIARFGVSDAAAVAGARMFVGLASSISAPTNVEPSTETNQIGIGQLSTSNNLHIIFGGSVAQTPIDLGVNFPANTLSVDWYEFVMFSPKDSSAQVNYRVTRLNTGDVADGFITNTTPGTTLPATTTNMSFRSWRTNNATALAVGLDIGSLIVHIDL
jgi:hypothetical protein